MRFFKYFLATSLIIMQIVLPFRSEAQNSGFAEPQPTVTIDINLVRQLLESKSNDAIIALLIQEMQQKSEDQIASELSKLSITEMQALYTILIESSENQETEDLALKLWELLEQKIKIELPPLYGDPRVVLIAKSWSEPEFWMVLSDRSVWYVDPIHLGKDDPTLQKILINSLLGNYIIKDSNSNNEGFPRVFESRRFPRGEFVGNMNVKKVNSDVIENKQIFFLEYGGFVK